MDLTKDFDDDLKRRLEALDCDIADRQRALAGRKDERSEILKELDRRVEAKRVAALPPVDRSKRELITGEKEIDRPDYREIEPSTGMQKSYVVLSAEERAKGFVRPVRRTYRHKPCNTTTRMGVSLAETYARDPHFYSGTFCVNCRAHFDLDQFVWEGTDEQVGS